MGLCPNCADSTKTFVLPPVFLQQYPDLEGLRNPNTRQTALAIYYYNRTIQSLFDSLSQGRIIPGLTDTFVDSILELLETSLSRVSSTCEAALLSTFIRHETVLFNDSRRRWGDNSG